jgi:hypothetical protein
MRRNVEVNAPRLISMCRQAILKKAPLYLYLALSRSPSALNPIASTPSLRGKESSPAYAMNVR